MSNKMKAIFIIIVGLILVVIGIFASTLLIRNLQSNQNPQTAEEVTVKTSVIVVTRDLQLGDTISEADVMLSRVPIEIAPRDVIATVEEAVGKMITTDLVQGEMVLLHNLADPTNTNRNLSFILSENHVLMAFPAEDLMSRESMVKRGDIIDIFASFTQVIDRIDDPITEVDESENPLEITFTIDSLQRVSVTAMVLEVIEEQSGEQSGGILSGGTGQTAVEAKTNIKAYLLALNPQDALILKHLKDTGAIFDIVLRNPTSTIEFNLTPVTENFIIEYYNLEILP